MDNGRLQKALDLAKQATELDAAADYEAALNYYRASLENWQVVCKYQQNAALREKLYQKMEPYIARAESIREYLTNQSRAHSSADTAAHVRKPPPPPPVQPTGKAPAAPSVAPAPPPPQVKKSSRNTHHKPPSSSTATPRSSGAPDEERDKFRTHFLSLVNMERPTVTWDDVVGLEKAKEALQEATILPLKFPELFSDQLQPWRGILLYGPPGTGKTHLARACAAAAAGSFLSVSSADLLSKWQGESEKLVRCLFEVAREQAPCTIFIDEVDSLCCARSDRENESSRRVKTELLVQMDGLIEHGGRDVLVLGATNAPWDLDGAIRRRFERRILVPLPDWNARRELLKKLSQGTALTNDDLNVLADATEGFSAADVTVAWRDARLAPLRKCRSATHWLRNAAGKFTPCGADVPGAVERTLFSLGPNELQPPLLSRQDALQSLQNAKKSVQTEDMQKYLQWTANYGLMGS